MVRLFCYAVGAAVALQDELRAVTRRRSRLAAEEEDGDEVPAAEIGAENAYGMWTSSFIAYMLEGSGHSHAQSQCMKQTWLTGTEIRYYSNHACLFQYTVGLM